MDAQCLKPVEKIRIQRMVQHRRISVRRGQKPHAIRLGIVFGQTVLQGARQGVDMIHEQASTARQRQRFDQRCGVQCGGGAFDERPGRTRRKKVDHLGHFRGAGPRLSVDQHRP